MIKDGFTDASKWFLFNRENSKYDLDLEAGGIVLDIGAYKGQFTEKILAKNNDLVFWLYEPISEYFQICERLFANNSAVTIYETAVSEDGRDFEMQVDGLRSRKTADNTADSIRIASTDIQNIFDSAKEFELLKMNIEGMEFECLEKLISTNSLVKAKYLLIQFHNFEGDSPLRLAKISETLKKDYENIWKYDWIWELWKRKDE